ncbi:hypothetical protein SPLC1_S511190 [Arthrospira platensis C1]|nr:hypothetical protein SPLC1_S511190 [Arthrospira platensis C1]
MTMRLLVVTVMVARPKIEACVIIQSSDTATFLTDL